MEIQAKEELEQQIIHYQDQEKETQTKFADLIKTADQAVKSNKKSIKRRDEANSDLQTQIDEL